jgi:glycosyltransferase involved in cell wall biosynthesis
MMQRRFAVVTPYHKEPRALLERCLASVAAQTVKTDHFLIADGFPQDWIDETLARHIRLDAPHQDYGNVARGIGALLAVSDAYDGIGFLDADNFLDNNHVASCVDAGRGGADAPGGADLVIAKRRFVRPDGSDFFLAEEPGHVDTSCWWFQPGSYHLLSFWVTMPRQVAPIGDRVFSGLIEASRLRTAQAPNITVNYTCMWEGVYRRFGEEPPPGAKPDIDLPPVLEWLCALSGEERRVVARLCAGDLVPWAERTLAELKGQRK